MMKEWWKAVRELNQTRKEVQRMSANFDRLQSDVEKLKTVVPKVLAIVSDLKAHASTIADEKVGQLANDLETELSQLATVAPDATPPPAATTAGT
jgi:dsDNA-specific endonuclease/ATPase MutS2